MVWNESTLGEICDAGQGLIKTGPFGSQLHQSDYSDTGTPVVMPKDIIGGRVSEASIARVSEEHVDRLSHHQLRPGDIVYGRRGDIGRCALVTPTESGWLCGTGCLKIHLGDGEVSSQFLFYYLNHPRTVAWILNQAIGATMPNLNTGILRSIPVRYPDRDIQARISSVLSAYDDLIDNNSRRIEILEEMARRLYEEWFVDFRFPGHEEVRFKESELGRIPEGWDHAPLESFGAIITGKTPTKKSPELFGSDTPFIKLPDMHGQTFITETNEGLSKEGEASQKKKTIPANSICVSCIGTGGIVVITSEPCQTNQQINTIVPARLGLREFLYFSALSCREDINNYGATGATMTNLSRGKFAALKVISPCKEVISSYSLLTASMFDQILNLQKANRNLRTQRDLLLPKLVSGKINVSNILLPDDKEVQAA